MTKYFVGQKCQSCNAVEQWVETSSLTIAMLMLEKRLHFSHKTTGHVFYLFIPHSICDMCMIRGAEGDTEPAANGTTWADRMLDALAINIPASKDRTAKAKR